MAKKSNNNQTSAENKEQVQEQEVVETETQTVEEVPATPAKKDNKQNKEKDTKKSKKQNKQPKRSRVKETVSELKKVSWPTFGQVCKKTGVVLAVVLIFAVVLFGIDRLLSWLFGLLTGI